MMKTNIKQLKKLFSEEFRKLLEAEECEQEGVSQSKRAAHGYALEEPVDYDVPGEGLHVEEEGVSQSKRANHGYDLEDPVDYKDVPGEGLSVKESSMPTIASLAEGDEVSPDVTKEKAKKILKHGHLHGKTLSKKQKSLFGLVAGGDKPSKDKK